ncbi:hypothetical protein HAX54_041614 [Datura stramonium]|uniref:Uncharacterized protein n=1 Tax=Datura stramonium TaxID=4076 RepID=A0ABS8SLF1_DATST|nr:hypothetical protein [Datura stramonium]
MGNNINNEEGGKRNAEEFQTQRYRRNQGKGRINKKWSKAQVWNPKQPSKEAPFNTTNKYEALNLQEHKKKESQPLAQVGEKNEVNGIINGQRDDSSSKKKRSNEEINSRREETDWVQKPEKVIIVWNPNKEGEDNEIEGSNKNKEMTQDKEQ